MQNKISNNKLFLIGVIQIAILVLGVSSVHANDTLQLSDTIFRVNLLKHSRLFIDSSGQRSLEELMAMNPDFDYSFKQDQESNYPEAFWLHIPISTTLPIKNARLLLNDNSAQDHFLNRLDYFDMYLLDSNNNVVEEDHSGLLVPKSGKLEGGHIWLPVVEFSMEKNRHYNLYLRLQNVHKPAKIKLAVELRSNQVPLPTFDDRYSWLVLAPWGMFLIIGLYVLVFYYFVRDPAFLYFGIFCLLYSIDINIIEPSSPLMFFTNEAPIWAYRIFHFSLFSVPVLMLFGKAFIDVKTNFSKAWNRYYDGLMLTITVVVSAYFIRTFWLPYLNFQFYFAISILFLVPICIRFLFSKIWAARLFAIAFFSFLGGNLLGVMLLPYDVIYTLIIWATGQVTLLFLFAVGLGRRLLESERIKAEVDKVKQLDLLKSRFFTNISHEFRTPLSLILGPLQMAEEETPYSDLENDENEIPIRASKLKVMKRNAVRLRQLINQILDLSKLDSGKMKLHIEKGAVIHFLKSRISEFKDIAFNKGIHLVTNYSIENQEAFFDKDKLEKIIINILSNAIKYTPSNNEIRFNAEADLNYLKVRVIDSGSGMKPEDVEKIFDRFYQSDQAVQQGSGIGMALVRDLIDLHKGQIFVESQLGKGTTVSFQISIAKQDYLITDFGKSASHLLATKEALLTLDQSENKQPESENQIGQNVVLIVEDNQDLQLHLKELLETEYKIILANDGQQGIDQALKYIPDIIISDVMMPHVSGYQLCSALKNAEKTCHIPVVLLTAKSEHKEKIKGLMEGAQEYLTKPFDAKELKTRIKNLLNLTKQLKEKYGNKPFGLLKKEVNSMDEQFLQKIQSQIEQNFSNEYYSVEALGAEIGYSRSQLFRKLKALTGKTPVEAIREYRLHFAKELLVKKAVTVSEAAYQTGYSNISYFSQSFKKEFGITPSEISKSK